MQRRVPVEPITEIDIARLMTQDILEHTRRGVLYPTVNNLPFSCDIRVVQRYRQEQGQKQDASHQLSHDALSQSRLPVFPSLGISTARKDADRETTYPSTPLISFSSSSALCNNDSLSVLAAAKSRSSRWISTETAPRYANRPRWSVSRSLLHSRALAPVDASSSCGGGGGADLAGAADMVGM